MQSSPPRWTTGWPHTFKPTTDWTMSKSKTECAEAAAATNATSLQQDISDSQDMLTKPTVTINKKDGKQECFVADNSYLKFRI